MWTRHLNATSVFMSVSQSCTCALITYARFTLSVTDFPNIAPCSGYLISSVKATLDDLTIIITIMSSVLGPCWLGDSKGILVRPTVISAVLLFADILGTWPGLTQHKTGTKGTSKTNMIALILLLLFLLLENKSHTNYTQKM